MLSPMVAYTLRIIMQAIPTQVIERKPLSRWHRRHQEPDQRRKFCASTTRQEKEGSEKTHADVRALHRHVQEVLDEKDQFLQSEEKSWLKLADQQTRIRRVREEIQGLPRTVGGSGFSLVSLRKEMDTKRRANKEFERRNHTLQKELRRVRQRLLHLGKKYGGTAARGRRELMSHIVTKQGRFHMTNTY